MLDQPDSWTALHGVHKLSAAAIAHLICLGRAFMKLAAAQPDPSTTTRGLSRRTASCTEDMDGMSVYTGIDSTACDSSTRTCQHKGMCLLRTNTKLLQSTHLYSSSKIIDLDVMATTVMTGIQTQQQRCQLPVQ